VKAGHEARFDAMSAKIDRLVVASPGNRASMRLEQPGAVQHLVSRFETSQDLGLFERSLHGSGIGLRLHLLPDVEAATNWKWFLLSCGYLLHPPSCASSLGLGEIAQQVKMAVMAPGGDADVSEALPDQSSAQSDDVSKGRKGLTHLNI